MIIIDLQFVRQNLNLGIPLSNIKLRVTDYSRVSTDNIKQINSLHNQIEHIDELIKNNSNWTYVQGYVDEGITGTSDIKRNNFMKMIEDAKKGKFDLIITKEISRFSRNTLDSIKYTRELLQYGVAVLFLNDNINTILPDSELRLTIMASMAQDEIRRLSERIKFGMNRAIINGNILGNNKLYGYTKNKTTGNLEINQKESKIIKDIYNMYLFNNMSLSQIVKFLNKNNIKTSMNNNFTVSTLSRMLKNPKYKGYYCAKKSEVIDFITKKTKYFDNKDWILYEDTVKIPPIVSKEIWNQTYQKLQKRSKKFNIKKDKNFSYKDKYLFSSKIFCNQHNSIFYRRKISKTNNDYGWCCSHYLKYGKYTCKTLMIKQSELYFILNDITNYLSINFKKISTTLFNIYISENQNSKIENKIKNYTQSLKKMLIKKDKLLDLNINDIISNDEFNIKNKQYDKEIFELNNKIKSITNDKLQIKENNSHLLNIINNKINTTEIKEQLYRILLNKILVFNSPLEPNTIVLNIYLNISNNYINNKKDSCFLTKEYLFNRKYNKVKNIKYIINYYTLT